MSSCMGGRLLACHTCMPTMNGGGGIRCKYSKHGMWLQARVQHQCKDEAPLGSNLWLVTTVAGVCGAQSSRETFPCLEDVDGLACWTLQHTVPHVRLAFVPERRIGSRYWHHTVVGKPLLWERAACRARSLQFAVMVCAGHRSVMLAPQPASHSSSAHAEPAIVSLTTARDFKGWPALASRACRNRCCNA
jgi:hypothetical protein